MMRQVWELWVRRRDRSEQVKYFQFNGFQFCTDLNDISTKRYFIAQTALQRESYKDTIMKRTGIIRRAAALLALAGLLIGQTAQAAQPSVRPSSVASGRVTKDVALD